MNGSTGPSLTVGELQALTSWYRHHQRDLPWRRDPRPWHVLVSEVMLQQTPVVRVKPVYCQWIQRWPTPVALAEATPADAIRAWGRLGYPRRAVRLHAAATACLKTHSGRVPDSFDELRALPGVGDYTAAAVASFGFGQRQAVLDTNVRRVQWRWLDGLQYPRSATPTRWERRRALQLLPEADHEACEVSIALMELGALVCRSRDPDCSRCPLRSGCRWLKQGRPASGTARPRQVYEGTDRQCRGALLDAVRQSSSPVSATVLAQVWTPEAQRERSLLTLVADGLLRCEIGNGGKTYSLPAI